MLGSRRAGLLCASSTGEKDGILQSDVAFSTECNVVSIEQLISIHVLVRKMKKVG